MKRNINVILIILMCNVKCVCNECNEEIIIVM